VLFLDKQEVEVTLTLFLAIVNGNLSPNMCIFKYYFI
jgi:hypothetical protein